jgi:hypothetical protein
MMPSLSGEAEYYSVNRAAKERFSPRRLIAADSEFHIYMYFMYLILCSSIFIGYAIAITGCIA